MNLSLQPFVDAAIEIGAEATYAEQAAHKVQGLSCEGACAHAHVRCAVARVRVRAKSILKSVRDVRACGSFSVVRCAMAIFTLFGTKRKENGIFLS